MRASITRHAMFHAGDRVGVAVSGGADSVALALLLKELQVELGAIFFVVHFNHQLRGAAADGDEHFAREFSGSLGWEVVAGRDDVAARAKENGWNLEDAGRRCRYEFFASVAGGRGAARVAVAHTADDQAETLVAHIVRGTGPTGLAGIYPVSGIVIRPMLGVRRDELREYLKSRGQAWREDSTNEDETRLRARIRRRLLPVLESDFQPAIVEHFGGLADLAREDEDFWRLLVDERFRALTRTKGEAIEVDAPALLIPFHGADAGASQHQQIALTKRLTRRILHAVRGDSHGFSSGHIDDILELAAKSESGSRIELSGGVTVEKSFETLRFIREDRRVGVSRGKKNREESHNFARAISFTEAEAASVEIPEIGQRLTLKAIDWPTAARDTIEQAIDWGSLRPPLVVRNWQPGDAFRPHGRLRTLKLKELFRVKHVPARERSAWPVLTSAGSVVWARGFPVAQNFVAGRDTRRTVIVVEEPL